MFALGNLFLALANVLDIILTVLFWFILYPIRKLLPLDLKVCLDLSPLLAFLAIIFIKSFLVRTLIDLSIRVRGA